MSIPTIIVRIAFADNPLVTTPTWTDVSSYVREIRIRRGRQDELNRMEAGTADVTLSNTDRRFDPTNTSSPYAPGVLPMRRINIRATWASVTYDLFTGYIESWPPDWPLSDDSSVTLPCVDAFGYLARARLSMSQAAMDAGANIDDMLDLISWPSGDRSINAGLSTLQAWTASDSIVLGMIQRLVESENGYFWVSADGKIYFRERSYRITNSRSTTSQGTFGDLAGELPYSAIVPAFDDTFIYNDVRITRTGGVQQTTGDSASIQAYFRRALIRSDLLIANDNEAVDAAGWLLSQYKDAALRFKRVTLDPQADDTNLWPHALGRDFHDRITVKRRPPGGGTAITQECFIEGVEHRMIAGPVTSWLTSWNLSPASSTGSYWVLDSATLSLLDSTTRLIY